MSLRQNGALSFIICRSVSAAKSLRTAIVLTMDTMKKLEAERKRIEDNKAAAKLKRGGQEGKLQQAAADGQNRNLKTASLQQVAADMKMSTGKWSTPPR